MIQFQHMDIFQIKLHTKLNSSFVVNIWRCLNGVRAFLNKLLLAH